MRLLIATSSTYSARFSLCRNIHQLVLQQGRPVRVAEVRQSQFGYVSAEQGPDDVQQDRLAIVPHTKHEERLFVPAIGCEQVTQYLPNQSLLITVRENSIQISLEASDKVVS